MKVATKVVYQMTEGMGLILIEKQEFDYSGPVELCDRAAVGAQKNLVGTDKQNAAEAGGQADTEHGELAPFYNREMTAEHLFNPNQNAELLTSAMAPTGAALGDAQHQAELQGARTRNASGFTKTLQQSARDKMKADAGASEGIASQDILGAKQLNQEGAAGTSDLFKSDQQKQLASLGLEEGAIQGQAQAGQSGWLQNLNQTMATIGSLGGEKGIKGLPGMGCWVAAATYGSWDHPRVDVVRQFIFNDWAKRSIVGNLVARLYLKFGERVAEVVKRSYILKKVFRKLFDII